MGNREALLAGAKRCLLEKGYARTTARDIASASNVSLAAIGYHFRSKEALLTEALMLAITEWDVELRHALAHSARPNATPLQRFESTWARLIETFETHRQMWVANFDIFSQMDRVPEIREVLGDSLQKARTGLASLFQDVAEEAVDPHTAKTVGAFYHALMAGVISQWLIDPANAPSARDLTDALRAIVADVTRPPRKPAKKRSASRR
jgi:AcrR family transcriptional regulator